MKNINNNNIIYLLYDDDDRLLNGIKYLLNNRIDIYEVYTPFPIHGLNNILKLKNTLISKSSFIYGSLGFIFSSILTWYTMNYDWPQNIGGKPYFSWYMNMPAFIPVIFELTIFFSAHFMCINYLISSKLYPGAKAENPDIRTTDDKFLIELRMTEPINQFISLFKNSGAIEISIKQNYNEKNNF